MSLTCDYQNSTFPRVAVNEVPRQRRESGAPNSTSANRNACGQSSAFFKVETDHNDGGKVEQTEPDAGHGTECNCEDS